MNAELLKQIALASLSFVYLIICYRLGARGKLSFRYTTGWILLFGVGLSSALLIPIVEPTAEYLELSPAAVVAGVGLVLLLAICVQLSVSISGLQEQVRTLNEEVAILKVGSESAQDPTDLVADDD
jgi:hypothetical protein